jgi:hypothetical protein
MTTHDEKHETDEADAVAVTARRPYRAPRLRALGSVREVTWGGSPQSIEGGLKGVPPKKGM